MAQPGMQHGSAPAQENPLIITRVPDGFRVYSPFEPGTPHLVTGVPGEARCTCPEFLVSEAASQQPCRHIEAVWTRFGGGQPSETQDPYEAEERQAIQAEGCPAPANGGPARPEARESQMLIKRSISPDGRIDSLSVEFSCPLNGETDSEVKERAMRFLELQSGIVAAFLQGNGKEAGNGNMNGSPRSQPQAVPAQITGIGSSTGKWGKRLFITFDVNGRNLRFYGSKSQIEQRFTEAGYAQLTNLIEDGVRFALPCRVVTEPSKDGKFQNVVQVLPPIQKEGRVSA